MYEESLQQMGLTKDQAAVYEILIQNGPQPARAVHQKSTLSRPLAYKVLDELIALGLVEKNDPPGKVSRFSAAHPLKLKEITEKRLEAAQGAKHSLDGLMGKLISDFNLQSGKPGIRFFEGKDGIRECINDALTSKTEIYSYVDIDTVEKEIPDISRDFAKARQKLGLKKKNIGVDTPENRAEIEGYYTDVTEERLIPWPAAAFGTVMQIYDGKVSYFTLGEQKIGIIIADPHVYEMHRSLFEFTWNNPLAYIPGKNQAASRNDPDSIVG
jgi:sugar-specific transcriptional regulator TrmB